MGVVAALTKQDEEAGGDPDARTRTAKDLIGQDVAIDCHDGRRTRGRLLNATARSLWVVTGDEDRFIAVSSIAHLDLAR